jgi:hypothetical protein
MRYGRTVALFRNDGSTVTSREFYAMATDALAKGLITEEGRIILCEDEGEGLFWFKGTKEKLHRKRQSTTC